MKTPELVAEQQANYVKRRQFAHSGDAVLARKFQADVAEYLRMRAQGVSREDAAKGLEALLREAIPPSPFTRPFTCAVCSDTGWEPGECDGSSGAHGAICGRQMLHDAHHFVRPCFCQKGAQMQGQVKHQDAESAAIAAAAKPRKRGGWTRPGQR